MKKTPASLSVVSVVALVFAAATLAARPCLASGFLIYDISGSALARASAVTADDEEPAAVWFNPANLAFMGGVSASAGGCSSRPRPASRRPAADPTPTPTAATSSCRSLRERPAHRPGGDWNGGLLHVRHRDHLALRLGRARERDQGVAGDADLGPERRRPGAPAGLGGGRVRRGPQRRRLHQRAAGDHRWRRAPGRGRVGLRLQRGRALQDLPGPAARGAHLPQPGQAGVRRRAGELQPREPGLRAGAARPGRHGGRSRCPTSSPSA